VWSLSGGVPWWGEVGSDSGEVPAGVGDDELVGQVASLDGVVDGVLGVGDLVGAAGHAVGADAVVVEDTGDAAWGGVFGHAEVHVPVDGGFEFADSAGLVEQLSGVHA